MGTAASGREYFSARCNVFMRKLDVPLVAQDASLGEFTVDP